MEIAICLPVSHLDLTHGTAMVCQEFSDSLTGSAPGIEIGLVAPQELSTDHECFRILDMPNLEGAWRTLRYEQFDLPRIVQDSGAEMLVMLYQSAPLGSSVPVAVIEALGEIEIPPGIMGRLLHATRSAGVQGVSKHYIYEGLETLEAGGGPVSSIEPWVHPMFKALSDPDDRKIASRYGLPYSYVIAHGIAARDVPAILAAWTWVDGSVGDSVPLAVIVSDSAEFEIWEHELERFDLSHSVRLLTGVKFEELPGLYRRGEAMLQGGRSVEHQLLRWAMACGLPVTGFDVPVTANTLGSAGYLVLPGDTRALGAACLTAIVEPEVKDRLRKDGLVRASAFHKTKRPADLVEEIAKQVLA